MELLTTIEQIPARCRRHTPADEQTVRVNEIDYIERLTWVVLDTAGSAGIFLSYNDALLAIAQTIQDDQKCIWASVRIEGHLSSWTLGIPDVVRAFRRNGTAYIPDTYSEERHKLRRSIRHNARY